MSSLSCWGPVVIYHLWEGGRGIWWDRVFQGNQGGRVVAISLIEYTGGNYRKLAANQLPMRGLIRILQGLMGRSGDFLS